MAAQGMISSGFLFRRKIDKLAGGAVIDWNSGPVLIRIEKAIAKVNKRGALRVKRKARGMIRQRAYETGDLYKSIKAYPSKYQYSGSIKLKRRVYTEWVIMAGGDSADYAMHVETGRYFKDTKTRVAAVPFMRSAAASTRKWLRPRMKDAIRRAIA
jgi:hypothetical protein